MEKHSKFIDLTLDYGFKIIFGNPDTPELMIGFLNELLPERKIVSIEFLNTEDLNGEESDKRVNFDIKCKEPDGGYFIVEMQKCGYSHFTDRLVVYAGGTIKHLLKRGEEYDKVRPLYIISVLDYLLDIPGESEKDRNRLVRTAQLKISESEKVLSDKLNYVFLQLPVVKSLTDSSTFLEKWAWSVRNMVGMSGKPHELKEKYFNCLYEHSDRQNISNDKLSKYDTMVRDEIQIRAEKKYLFEHAIAEGLKQGREQGLQQGLAEGLEKGLEQGLEQGLEKGMEKGLEIGRAEAVEEMAAKLKAMGMAVDAICEVTGLSKDKVSGM